MHDPPHPTRPWENRSPDAGLQQSRGGLLRDGQDVGDRWLSGRAGDYHAPMLRDQVFFNARYETSCWRCRRSFGAFRQAGAERHRAGACEGMRRMPVRRPGQPRAGVWTEHAPGAGHMVGASCRDGAARRRRMAFFCGGRPNGCSPPRNLPNSMLRMPRVCESSAEKWGAVQKG